MVDMTPSEVDAIPGTKQFLDLDGSVVNATHDKKHGEVVLIPTPSKDPDDPLNWSQGCKHLQLFCVVVYCLFIGMASAAVYSVMVPLAIDTGLQVADLNAGTGYMLLMLGLGCIITQPLALQYGKRPVYLVSMLATVGIQVWSAHCRSNGEWFANKILQGFFGSPLESLCEITVADLRGKYMAVYAFALSSSSTLAPIFAGFIYDSMGYKWVLYFPALGCGLAFLILFFCMEETNYTRHLVVESVPLEGSNESDGSGHAKDAKVESSTQPAASSHSDESGAGHAVMGGSKKTYWQKLKLIQTSPENLFWTRLTRPFIFVSLPIVLYCGFGYGCIVMWVNMMSGTASLILSYPPYNFEAKIVGLFSIGSLLGVIFGSVFGGVASDWINIKLAKRNGGIMEAENRLWLNLYPAIMLPFCMILYGVGAANGIHWFGLAVAGFVMASCVAVVTILMLNYCIDCYPSVSGEAMVLVIVIRNCMAFAIGYIITPWIKIGYQDAFISAAFIAMACTCLFLVFVKYGKKLRIMSRHRYARYVKQAHDLGIAH